MAGYLTYKSSRDNLASVIQQMQDRFLYCISQPVNFFAGEKQVCQIVILEQ